MGLNAELYSLIKLLKSNFPVLIELGFSYLINLISGGVLGSSDAAYSNNDIIAPR